MTKRIMKSAFGALIAVIVLSAFGACKNDTQAGAETVAQQTPKKKLVFSSEDDVKAFIADNLKKPIPKDYQFPKYITSNLPLDQVYDSLKHRYPQFYGKEGRPYLQAIMADPETYLKMNLESKSIRRFYDPNSAY